MKRRRKDSTPAPQNIANREYFSTIEATDAHDTDIDFPVSLPEAETQQRQQDADNASRNVRSTDVYDFVEITHERTPSPSPSDIVLGSDLRDLAAMSELERETRGLERKERKRVLLEMQEVRRAERERVVEEERAKREYEEVQRKGREEV